MELIAINSSDIFWTNWDLSGGTGRTMGLAELNGSDVNQKFITGASGPFGIALPYDPIRATRMRRDYDLLVWQSSGWRIRLFHGDARMLGVCC